MSKALKVCGLYLQCLPGSVRRVLAVDSVVSAASIHLGSYSGKMGSPDSNMGQLSL